MHKAVFPTQPHGTDRIKWKLALVLLHWRWSGEWDNTLIDFYNFLFSWNLNMRYKIMLSKWSILSIVPVPVKTRNHLNIGIALLWSSWCAEPFGRFAILLFLAWAMKLTATVQIITERTLLLLIHLKNHYK